MAKSFAVTTTATDTLKGDAKGHAEALFTVTNTTPRPIRGIVKAKALGDTKQEWLSIAGDTERDFAAGATQQFTVGFDAAGAAQPPPATPSAARAGSSAPAGKYPFRLDVASARNKDEDFTEGPTVNVEVAAAATPAKKSFPLWIIFVILGVVLLIAEPAAGDKVQIGSNVKLFVSMGPTRVIIPSVSNLPVAAAQKLLETSCGQPSCLIVVTQSRNDDKVPPGNVIGTEPGGNQAVNLGSTVTLIVSTGPELKTVRSYISLHQTAATQQIVSDGFMVGEVRKVFPFPSLALGVPIVVSQDPAPGTKHPKGTKINLVVK